jgi:ubiquinone/menaquinone biosynthesis C-methylase UbiE
MSIRSKVFAVTYDRQIRKAEQLLLAGLRASVLAAATGDVLEIGSGTGANLGAYPETIASLTMTEPEPAMLRRLQRKADAANQDVTALRAPAEDLPFERATFDTVVSTLVLCGVSDQQRALRQITRVLRPGGRLLFIEHVRSDDPKLARHQDRMNWLNRLVVCCECNRPTASAIAEAGFAIDTISQHVMPKAPKFVGPVIAGAATMIASAPPNSYLAPERGDLRVPGQRGV